MGWNIQYDGELYGLLRDLQLAIFIRQLATLLNLDGRGVDYKGEWWTYQTRQDWAAMFVWSERQVSRAIRRGIESGVLVRQQLMDNRRLYRLDADALRGLYAEQGKAIPAWLIWL